MTWVLMTYWVRMTQLGLGDLGSDDFGLDDLGSDDLVGDSGADVVGVR